MNQQPAYKGFTATVEFDAKDRLFFGRLDGISDIVTFHRHDVFWSPSQPTGALAGWQQRLQDLDRILVDAVPSVGRYCWETVIGLER